MTDQGAPAAPRSEKSRPEQIPFNVNAIYDIKGFLGKGAYGDVASALHKPSGTMVAIKKIQPFDHPMFALRTLREIKLLRYFDHENIITILDIERPRSFELFKEVYLIQEMMETDLHRVIRTQTLSNDHCQYFIYQTLRGLKAMHSANVIHRDLKPSNLLLNGNCDLKIIDFGLARHVGHIDDNQGFMTEYVATRWYRAPEIMLTFKKYTSAIDIWSVGCIMAEMLLRKPLFPGKDYHDQLKLIFEVLGTPQMDDFYSIKSSHARNFIRSMQFFKRIPWETVFEAPLRQINNEYVGKIYGWDKHPETQPANWECEVAEKVGMFKAYDPIATKQLRAQFNNDLNAYWNRINDLAGKPGWDANAEMAAKRDEFLWRKQVLDEQDPEAERDRADYMRGIEFLDKLLAFNPAKRPTASDAMYDPWVSGYHDPNDEPTAPPVPDDFFFFDKTKDKINLATYKRLIYEEIMR